MVNTKMLEGFISNSGLKKRYLAERLGISPEAFARKVRGKSEFKVSEMRILCRVLNITDLGVCEEVFFSEKH